MNIINYQMNVFSGTLLWYLFLIGPTGCRTALPKAVVVSKSSCCQMKPELVDFKMTNFGLGEFETGNFVGSFSSLTAGKWSLHCLSRFGYSTYISSCDVG